MTAETDLLPLPEPVAVKYPDSGLRDDEHALRLWVAHGYDTGGEPLFSAEQLREAVAPLQAEIEALRAEVEEWKSVASAQAELHDEAERCAEELAKALAGLITWIPSADTYRRLGFDPSAPMRALEKARAALGREAGND